MRTLKTNEEIKKEISEAMEELSWVVEGGDAHDLQDACDKAHACLADTLALIERLEKSCDGAFETRKKLFDGIAELLEALNKLQAERDAVMRDMTKNCASCKYAGFNNPGSDGCPYVEQCQNYGKWEWRGIPKEDGNEKTC